MLDAETGEPIWPTTLYNGGTFTLAFGEIGDSINISGDQTAINFGGVFILTPVSVAVTTGNDIGFQGTGQLKASTNGAATPAYSFAGDTTTGSYLIGAGQIGFSCAGTLAATLTGSGLTLASGSVLSITGAGFVSIPAGSVGTPAINFGGASDGNCGMYRVGADQIGFSCAGALVLTIAAGTVTLASNTAIAFAGTGASTTRDNLGASSGIWPVTLGGTGVSSFPKVGAYKSADQNITGGAAAAKVTFDTEEYDTGSNFATSTFTCPRVGHVRITAAAFFGSVATAATAVYLYKNGSQFKRLNQAPQSAAGGTILGGSVTIAVASTDTLEIYAFSDTNVTITGASTVTYCNFEYLP
jgi:hypothetical protein